MKVYVTKYALTQGIFTAEGEVKDNGRCMIGPWFQLLSKNEWATTREHAIQQADEMRLKKLTSLRKQIERFAKLKIEVRE